MISSIDDMRLESTSTSRIAAASGTAFVTKKKTSLHQIPGSTVKITSSVGNDMSTEKVAAKVAARPSLVEDKISAFWPSRAGSGYPPSTTTRGPLMATPPSNSLRSISTPPNSFPSTRPQWPVPTRSANEAIISTSSSHSSSTDKSPSSKFSSFGSQHDTLGKGSISSVSSYRRPQTPNPTSVASTTSFTLQESSSSGFTVSMTSSHTIYKPNHAQQRTTSNSEASGLVTRIYASSISTTFVSVSKTVVILSYSRIDSTNAGGEALPLSALISRSGHHDVSTAFSAGTHTTGSSLVPAQHSYEPQSEDSPGHGLARQTRNGIIAGSAIGAAVMFFFAAFLFLRRRRRTSWQRTEDEKDWYMAAHQQPLSLYPHAAPYSLEDGNILYSRGSRPSTTDLFFGHGASSSRFSTPVDVISPHRGDSLSKAESVLGHPPESPLVGNLNSFNHSSFERTPGGANHSYGVGPEARIHPHHFEFNHPDVPAPLVTKHRHRSAYSNTTSYPRDGVGMYDDPFSDPERPVSQVKPTSSLSSCEHWNPRDARPNPTHNRESFATRREKVRSDPFDLEKIATARDITLTYTNQSSSADIGTPANLGDDSDELQHLSYPTDAGGVDRHVSGHGEIVRIASKSSASSRYSGDSEVLPSNWYSPGTGRPGVGIRK